MTSSLDPNETAGTQFAPVSKNPATSIERPHRLQFSLTSLLMLTAVLAVGVMLLKHFGHWGLVCITLLSFVFTFYVARKSKSASKRFLVDMLWGIVLPLLCFAYDPGLFHSPVPILARIANMIMATALWQMVLLMVWICRGSMGPIGNGSMAGGMFVGSILAGLIAVPYTLVAIFSVWLFGVSLPGFVPVMTTWVYSRNWNQASFLVPKLGRDRRRFDCAFALSLVVAALGPALIVYAASTVGWVFQFPHLAKPDLLP
jgi:hypothetical protein